MIRDIIKTCSMIKIGQVFLYGKNKNIISSKI